MRIRGRKRTSPLSFVGLLLAVLGTVLSLFPDTAMATEYWVSGNDRDIYFTVTSEETIVLRTYAAEYGIDSMLWLYDPSGQIVAQNDDWFGLDSYISYPAQPGIYRMRAGVCCGDPDRWYGNQYRVDASATMTEGPSGTTTSTSSTTTTNPPPAGVEIPESGAVLVELDEGNGVTVSAPEGYRFSAVLFASYGTPYRSGNQLFIGECHSRSSEQVVSSLATGTTSFGISADNGVFGDPCGGTYKNFKALISYEPDPDYTTTTTSTTTTSTTTTSTVPPSTTTTEPETTTTTTQPVTTESPTTSLPVTTTPEPSTTTPETVPPTTEPSTTTTVPPTRNVTTTTRPPTTTTEVPVVTTTLPPTTTTSLPQPAADPKDETPTPSVKDDPKVVETLTDMGFSASEVEKIAENADDLVDQGFSPEQAVAIAAEAQTIVQEGFSEEDALRVAVEDASPLAQKLGKSTRVKAKIGPISLRIVVTPTERRSIIAVGATMVFGGATILSGSSVSSTASTDRRRS